MEMKKVYVLLTDTGTLFTKTIQQYTKAKYNHSSISFDADLIELYSFGRKHPKNPINGGFVREDVLHGTYRAFPQTTCAIYELEVTARQYDKMLRVVELFKKNRGKFYYNLLGVFGVAMKEQFEPKSSYFCSQFVAEILSRSGLRYFHKATSLITPEDIQNISDLTLIYEGKLYDYPPILERLQTS